MIISYRLATEQIPGTSIWFRGFLIVLVDCWYYIPTWSAIL